MKVWTVSSDEQVVGVYFDKKLAEEARNNRPDYYIDEWEPMLTAKVLLEMKHTIEAAL
jgi:hypothetical protein